MEGVTYEIECSQCECVYIGETARNAYTRGLEHSNQLSSKSKHSVLHHHTETIHGDAPTPPEFTMTVTDVLRGG